MEFDLHGKFYEAGEKLKGVVSHFYHIYHVAGEVPVIKHLAPSLEMLLVFNFGPAIAISFQDQLPGEEFVEKIAVLGPLRKMLNYELLPGTDALVVNFVLDGFYRLFNVPVSGIADHDWNQGHYLTELWDELALLTDVQERIDLTGSFIVSVANQNEAAVMPLLAGEAYFFDPAIQPSKAIASDAGLTERCIQLRFQKYAGYSPKELLRFLRFKAVINHLMKGDEKAGIFELITGYQYHDQSHLIKDFKYFLGVTPQQFIKTLKGRQFFITGQDKK